jgi:Ca2+-binding RTX toxin-like protein
MTGGAGDDTYILDSALDVVVEAAGGGTDTVNSAVDYTLGAELENLLLTGVAINGTGNAANNVITGNVVNNVLSGLAGNDTLDGGAGNDTLNGGIGSDRLVSGAGLDVFQFNTALAADNVDAVADFVTGDVLQLDRAIFSALSAGTTLTAAEFLSGAGVAAATNGQQRILHDTTTGALRYDSDGNGAAAAVLFANLNVGAPLTAAAIALTGTGVTPPPPPTPGVINGTVNADNLLGTAANDTINGLAGNDTINGAAGNDTMNGGLGDDTFTVDSTLDVVVEALNEGTDTVLSSVNYTLAANVEHLTLTGTALTGTGNALANLLTGNASNNTLNGAAGNDTMTGGAGNDDLNGGTGVDALTGGTGADTFRFDANGPANSDQITDFNIAEGDRIALAASVFTDIGNAGAGLTAAQFLAGPGVVSATSRAQRILFNTTTGALFWDVDGSRNNNAPIQFATVNPVAALTNTQFILV